MTAVPSVTILGEAMVELAPTDTPNLVRVGFAGDTFNTAWYLAQLWSDAGRVSYATCVGTDDTSARFRRFAEGAGIRTDLIGTHPSLNMGLYMIHLSEGERSFSYWRSVSAARTLADDMGALERAIRASGHIYLSGITVAILPPGGRDRLARALHIARSEGRQVYYDTNLRPKLWESADQMGRETERFARLADVVLPSFDDDATHFGFSSTRATAGHYHALGAGLVVVKNGDGDVLVSQDGRALSIALDPVTNPVDTTAAGDSFSAGFLSDYLVSEDPVAAVKTASALARRVIMETGALVPAALAAREAG